MAQKDISGQVKPEYSGLDDLDRRVTALYKAKTGNVFLAATILLRNSNANKNNTVRLAAFYDL